jgi:hypothetical protein
VRPCGWEIHARRVVRYYYAYEFDTSKIHRSPIGTRAVRTSLRISVHFISHMLVFHLFLVGSYLVLTRSDHGGASDQLGSFAHVEMCSALAYDTGENKYFAHPDCNPPLVPPQPATTALCFAPKSNTRTRTPSKSTWTSQTHSALKPNTAKALVLTPRSNTKRSQDSLRCRSPIKTLQPLSSPL